MTQALAPQLRGGCEADDHRLLALLSDLTRDHATMGRESTDPCRRAYRHTISAPVRLHAVEHDLVASDSEPGWATDISLHGIGFLAQIPFHSGRRYVIDLAQLTGSPLLLSIKVIYCQQLLDHTYRIGASFQFLSTAHP